jgi:hypothetical protein
MATQFTIITGDTSETFTVKPKHILRSEREGKDESPVESTYRLAYYAAGAAVPFDEWIELVDDIVPILPDDDVAADEVPPTTGGSRRSRSAQA